MTRLLKEAVFGEKQAKVIGEIIFCMGLPKSSAGLDDGEENVKKYQIKQDTAEEAFDGKNVTTWKGNPGFMNKFNEIFKDDIKAVKQSMDANMEEHVKWHGAMARVTDKAMLGEVGAFPFKTEQKYAAEAVTLVAVRRNRRRVGAVALPLMGAGALLCPEETSLWVVAHRIEAILSEGVALSDFDSFLEMAAGTAMTTSKDAAVVQVRDGECLYVPSGWLYTVVTYYPADKKTFKGEPGWG